MFAFCVKQPPLLSLVDHKSNLFESEWLGWRLTGRNTVWCEPHPFLLTKYFTGSSWDGICICMSAPSLGPRLPVGVSWLRPSCDPLPLSLTSLLVSSSDCYLDWFLIVFVKLNQNINKYGDDNAVSIWPVITLYGQAMRTEHLTRSHINVCACVLDGAKNVGNERGDSRGRICNTVWR